MGTTWVLHTETKGTGAQMVPLESLEQRSPSSSPPRDFLAPKRDRARPGQESKPRQPRRFKVVDVMTRQELVDGASAKEAVDALKDVRSIVDVNVYVWQEERDRWRPLTFEEQRALMELTAA